jgi:hypothetical protein
MDDKIDKLTHKKYTRDRINYLCADMAQMLQNFTDETGLMVRTVYIDDLRTYSGEIHYSCIVMLE